VERILIKDVLSPERAGQRLSVCGWVKTKRESKGFAFLVISDGSTQDTLQLFIPGDSPAFRGLHRCNTGAAICTTGILRESPAKGQKFEMEISEITVLGDAEPETYPLQKKGHTLEFLREITHLRSRTNTFGAVFRLRNILAAAVHDFFQSRGFLWIHTPIITASDCEGAGDLFTVTSLDLRNAPKTDTGDIDFSQDFFGRRAYLTVSGQLEAEFLAMSLGNVYTFGPTFRAENSNTTRHLSEFWMIEPEMAFADLRDDMRLAEDFFRFLCKQAIEKGARDLAFLESQYKRISCDDLAALAETPFAHISYTDTINELKAAKDIFEFPVTWGADLQSEHERYLVEKHFKKPVIVRNYPKHIKAFYMRQNDDGKTVAAMDILAPGIGEIVGGSQREERMDKLVERMKEMHIPTEELWWYLDTRRFGTVPHSGFGLGFERMVQFVTGMGNIRDVIPFPRTPKTADF
jgi:asparaginyl-tRNA synthetase